VFFIAVSLRHNFWLAANRTHTWCFKLTHINTIRTDMSCMFLHVLQIIAFCCENYSFFVMPEFPHPPRNITEKSGPNNNANNASSADVRLESLSARHRLTEGCFVPLGWLTSRPMLGEKFLALPHALELTARHCAIITFYVVCN
jgi:hypothetical protein